MKKLLVIFLVLAFVVGAFALDYPRKTVSVVCPWGAGGGTDRLARFLADELSKELGEPFVVVNKTGGGGAVGHGAGAYANPDGYTIMHSLVSPSRCPPGFCPDRSAPDLF
ncbi:MAG: tripartite tricarboxylate transporter substrate-binding protein [Kosmotogaceae bacterium]